MANQLSMARRRDIVRLYELGYSRRAIARTLGVDRETVGRYVRLGATASEPANVPAGANGSGEAKPAIPPAGSAGRVSQCQSFREIVEPKLRQGLTAQRIWQDLRTEQGYVGSYDSVKRFVRRLTGSEPEVFRRMECPPGQEAQVDFGRGAPIRMPNGRTKRPHVFRIVLSYSRKGYSEAVWHEDAETFLRCLENAFRHFGGVPKTLVVDNLKAAVLQADWYDPELNPKLEAFCRHYGTVILPTRPRKPQHKGKVESGVGYVQDNGLKGHEFTSLAEHNRHLDFWEAHVADTRIHGTTRRQVGKVFEEEERPALLAPLPPVFPSFAEAIRTVHRDGHVEVQKAYYSVPPEYVGRAVWARWDGRIVRVYNERFEPIAVHVKAEPGRFQTEPQHISSRKRSVVDRGAEYMLKKARWVGPYSHEWAKTMLTERGIPGLRVLQGFLQLARKHEDAELERVCEIARRNGSFRLKTLRHLLGSGPAQGELEFLRTHPIIRELSDYEQVIQRMVAAT
jgi:transposase